MLTMQTTSAGLAPFHFDGREIRVITGDDGEPLFVGRDVCDALGYANAADAINRHCRGVAKRYPLQTSGGVQDVRVLGEPDILRLIVNCALPAAQPFERLVFEEILPTIRRTGTYSLPAAPAIPAVPQTFAAAPRLAADQQEVIAAQAEQLAAAAPAVEFVERYADSTGTKGFRQVAKLLKANESQFRDFLIDEKILYRLGRELTPHAQHITAGRFCVKAGTADSGHAYNSARFTPKGVTWVAGEWAKWQLKQREKEAVHA
jgi:prophage antirepressor-like protein